MALNVSPSPLVETMAYSHGHGLLPTSLELGDPRINEHQPVLSLTMVL